MKSLLESSRSRAQLRGAALVLSLVMGAFACGVVEHPHDVQAIDTSNDFGPLAGAATTIPGAAHQRPAAALPASSAAGLPAIPLAALPERLALLEAAVAARRAAQRSAPAVPSVPAGKPATTGGAGAPSSGVTITLGGVNVPKEKAIAFIHIGHSNMYGEASSPSGSRAYHYTQTDPHAFMYHAGSSPTLAKEPTADKPPTTRRPGAGPGTALVKESVAARSRLLLHLARLWAALGVLLAVRPRRSLLRPPDRRSEGDQGASHLRRHLHLPGHHRAARNGGRRRTASRTVSTRWSPPSATTWASRTCPR